MVGDWSRSRCLHTEGHEDWIDSAERSELLVVARMVERPVTGRLNPSVHTGDGDVRSAA